MDLLKTVDLGAVAKTWGEVAKNLPTHAPNFYIALLKAHPEYHALFPTIASVPVDQLPGNAALQKLSESVLGKLNTLIQSAGDAEALAKQLTELGPDHKKLGVKRSDFDNLGAVLVNFLGTALGAGFSDADRTAWTNLVNGINTVIEAAL